MAREPLRKEVDRMFRCLDEDGFLFPGKVEYLGHDSGEEVGHQDTHWVLGKIENVACPNDPTHRIELVEE